MHLTMTVIDTQRAALAPRHVLVEAESGTLFGDVRSQLADVAGVPLARGSGSSGGWWPTQTSSALPRCCVASC